MQGVRDTPRLSPGAERIPLLNLASDWISGLSLKDLPTLNHNNTSLTQQQQHSIDWII